MTRISVAMTTCQGERYVAEQLESIMSQSRPPDELIVCDDGSTDQTRAIVEAALADVAFRVEVISNPRRLGVVANVEQAIRRTTGDIVVLADHDDIWRPQKLARLEECFATRPDVDALFSDALIVDQWGWPTGKRLWECIGFTNRRRFRWASDPVGVLLQGNVVTGACLAFRASLKDLLLPLAPTGWHDLWIAALIAATGRMDALDEALLAYRVHGRNTAGLPASVRTERDRRLVRPQERGEALQQIEALAARLEERGFATTSAIRRLRAKASHLALRIGLPSGIRARGVVVARATARGQYHRYSAGLMSAVFDLAYGGRHVSPARAG